MGYTYTILKGFAGVDADFALIFLSYNMKRVMTILGKKGLKEALKGLKRLKLEMRSLERYMLKIIMRRMVRAHGV